jgi:hypothetical protein
MFGEFYDATLATPELAVYVIRVGEDGEFSFEDANEVVAKVAGLTAVGDPRPDARRGPAARGGGLHTTHLRTCVETGLPMAYQRTFEFPTGRCRSRPT